MNSKLIIICLVLLVFTPAMLFSEKKNYTHILVLGADQTISNSETNKFNTVLMYFYNFPENKNGWYGQFNLTTTNIKLTLGRKKKSYFAGIVPQFNHTVYGGYYLYDRGVFLENRTFAGHKAGIEFFLENKFTEILTMRAAYLPDYHFYQKLKKDNPVYGVKEETQIDIPSGHWQHSVIIESSLGKVDVKDLNRIQHGLILRLKYKLSKRSGWKSYNDVDPATGEGRVSDETVLHRFYCNFGAYYDVDGFNFLFDIMGSIQDNIDRTDSEQIGSFVAEHGIMPGYFIGEFLHDRYIIGWMQIGFPVPFWSTRIQPGFAMLYMPENNGVIGVDNYPKKIYKSVSCVLSTRIVNILPLFLYYGYGIDADRINISDNTSKKGNHEFLFYVLTAF